MKNIYLIGFMGSGKSTVGKLLARRLKRRFCDTDEMVEAKAGRSIAEIFAEWGETYFRKLECQVIKEVAQKSGQVVALGGGAPLSEENRQIISSTGTTVYLQTAAETLFARLKEENSRPLLGRFEGHERLERIRSLLRLREPYYKQAELIVECQNRTPEALVEKILEGLKDANPQS
jgi:shikimate kinase